MKGLTLTQPWAQMVADGRKAWETRSWATTHRGELAIHAAKGWSADDRGFARALGYDPASMALGAIVAIAHVGMVRGTGPAPKWEGFPAYLTSRGEEAELTVGDFSPGRWAWGLEHIERLTVPVPCRGMLGIWTVPYPVVQAVIAARPSADGVLA